MNVNPKVRTQRVGIRVTPEEKKILIQRSAEKGMTLTSYILESVIGGEKKDAES